jgi:aspartate racemase
MRKLGIMGGFGQETTVAFYRGIVDRIKAKYGDECLPDITIESMSIFEVLDLCEHGRYAPVTDYLTDGMRNLDNAGCDIIAMAGVTPHIVFPEVEAHTSKEMISMVDVACESAASDGYEKVALIGTLPTMSGTFMQWAFGAKKIEIVTPNEKEMEELDVIIRKELNQGIVRPESKQRIKDIVKRLDDENDVEAVLLGATEFSLIFGDKDFVVPTIDMMKAHMDKLAGMIID